MDLTCSLHERTNPWITKMTSPWSPQPIQSADESLAISKLKNIKSTWHDQINLLYIKESLLVTIPYNTIPYNTIPYNTIPYNTIPYHTIPYHTIPYHTIPYHTILYHTIPYHTLIINTSITTELF